MNQPVHIFIIVNSNNINKLEAFLLCFPRQKKGGTLANIFFYDRNSEMFHMNSILYKNCIAFFSIFQYT